MEFIFSILVIGLFFWVRALSARVSDLETKLNKREQVPCVKQVSKVVTAEEMVPPVNLVDSAPEPISLSQRFSDDAPTATYEQSVVTPTRNVDNFSPQNLAPEPETEFFLYTWFKEQTLIKIGAIIFFLGAVWFVGYAISVGWISQSMRITLGLLMSLVVYGIGYWRFTRLEETQYVVLTTLGSAIGIATVFAGQFVFAIPFFTTVTALGCLVLFISYTVYVSIKTNLEWLSLVCVLAGYLAPFLIGPAEPNYLGLATYEAFISLGFLSVVFFTGWRNLTLLTVVCASLLEMGLSESTLTQSEHWFFMILFSTMFFIGTSISLYRSKEPDIRDLVSLGITGLLFSFYAEKLPSFSALAMFVASFVIASVGYLLYQTQASRRVVAVFVCFSSGAWLLGTSYLLSGGSLLMVLTVEITLAFILLTHLQLSSRAIYLSALTYAIPFFMGLNITGESNWVLGGFNVDVLATFLTFVSLLVTTVWLLENPAFKSSDWPRKISMFMGSGLVFYGMAYLDRFANVITPVGSSSHNVLVYVSTMVFSFALIIYVTSRLLPFSWVIVSLLPMILSVLYSIGSFGAYSWGGSVLNVNSIGLYINLCVLGLMTLNFGLLYRQFRENFYLKSFVVLSLLCLAYLFGVVATFWNVLFATGDSAVVLIYVTYALVVYFINGLLWQTSKPFPAILYVSGIGIIPLLLSLNSFDSSYWVGANIISLHPVGLFVITILLFVSALRSFGCVTDNEKILVMLETWQKILFTVGGLYTLGLVWQVTHSLFSSNDLAVTVSLFIYTVTGLALYVISSIKDNKNLKYAGASLLVFVVIHLVVFEVANMEVISRIVTFLGIGFLFMAAAFLEKKKM